MKYSNLEDVLENQEFKEMEERRHKCLTKEVK